jgi:predicted ATPase
MANFTLRVKNLRGLRSVEWSPRGTSVLIGANGAGKSTLLQTLKLLRAAYDHGLPRAVTSVLHGSYNLRNWSAPEEQPIELGVDLDDIAWRVQLTPRGPTVEHLDVESMTIGGAEVFSREKLGAVRGMFGNSERLILRGMADADSQNPSIQRLAALIRNITVFHDPDLWSLKTRGSETTDERHLHSRGRNTITMLRKWYQERSHRFRYQFVLDGLRAAFPEHIADIDFKEAGTTLVLQVYRPGSDVPGPLAAESNGLLQMLVLLCDLAGAEEDGILAIDQPEDSLHPYAIREFFRRADAWAQERRLTVLLATHSPVLLDQLTGHPDRVFVLHPGQDGPTRIDEDEAINPKWLANFRIGELYARGDLGSNDEP